MMESVIEALTHVHQLGLIHGDLNTGNVLVLPHDAEDESHPDVLLLGLGVDRLLFQAAKSTKRSSIVRGVSTDWRRNNRVETPPTLQPTSTPSARCCSNSSPAELPTQGTLRSKSQPPTSRKTVPLVSDHCDDPTAEALDIPIAKMLSKESEGRPGSLDELREMLRDARREAGEMAARAHQTGTRDDIELWADELLGSPEDPEMLEALKREAKQYNAWGAALEVIEEAALVTDDGATGRTLLLEGAKIAVDYLKQFEKASEIYNQLAESNPDDSEVQLSILHLLRAEERFDDLIERLAATAEITEDIELKFAIIRQIADVYENDLKDYFNAFDYTMACTTCTDPNENRDGQTGSSGRTQLPLRRPGS